MIANINVIMAQPGSEPLFHKWKKFIRQSYKNVDTLDKMKSKEISFTTRNNTTEEEVSYLDKNVSLEGFALLWEVQVKSQYSDGIQVDKRFRKIINESTLGISIGFLGMGLVFNTKLESLKNLFWKTKISYDLARFATRNVSHYYYFRPYHDSVKNIQQSRATHEQRSTVVMTQQAATDDINVILNPRYNNDHNNILTISQKFGDYPAILRNFKVIEYSDAYEISYYNMLTNVPIILCLDQDNSLALSVLLRNENTKEKSISIAYNETAKIDKGNAPYQYTDISLHERDKNTSYEHNNNIDTGTYYGNVKGYLYRKL
jgi:hypothetical protein